jgi:6-phosphogluconate dehydrogenase
MSKQQIGVVGMAVMGRNLALNIESRGYTVSIFNRSGDKTDEVIAENPGKNLVPHYTVEEFVESLEKPRRILLMVKAGEATDKTIASLTPHLDKGDILIDGGNTYYQDTIRRNRELSDQGFNFIGTGVSGGEEGALKGPSIMPGGQKEAYELVAPILEKIAAVAEGEPCVTYIGADGAGHYVKMVHNGIEYGDMQLIAEAYSLLKQALNLSNEELADTFAEWNKGELNSYLIDITKDIFTKKDEEGKYLVDVILDEAANKGTGKWTSQSSLDLGEPLSLITESVFARYLSSLKDQRVAASKVLTGPKVTPVSGDKAEFVEKVRRALYLGKIVSYAQGFSQLKAASKENNWICTTATLPRSSAPAASSVHSSCRKSPTLMHRTRISLTCCWHLTSSRLLTNISRRCVTWCPTRCRTASLRRPSLRQSPTTTATVQRFCLPT